MQENKDERLGYVDYQGMTMQEIGLRWFDWKFWGSREMYKGKYDMNKKEDVLAYLAKIGFDEKTLAERKKEYAKKYAKEKDWERMIKENRL